MQEFSIEGNTPKVKVQDKAEWKSLDLSKVINTCQEPIAIDTTAADNYQKELAF